MTTHGCRFVDCDATAIDDGRGGIEWATNMGTPDHDHALPDDVDHWPGLEVHGYRHLVIDPPWRYAIEDRTKAEAVRQYSTMGLDELAALPVADLAHADGAVVWLWATNRMLALGDAGWLARQWGSTPVTVLTWAKQGQPGVGWRLRSNTEHCILATIGTPPLPPAGRAPASLQQWVRASGGKSRSHSSKPAGFYDLVEAYTPGPYVDLFSRAPRLGWDHWGHGYEVAASGPPNTTMAR